MPRSIFEISDIDEMQGLVSSRLGAIEEIGKARAVSSASDGEDGRGGPPLDEAGQSAIA